MMKRTPLSLPERREKISEDRQMYRSKLMDLALPIIIQNLLSSAVNSMDVVMLNFVGQDAISAVSLASQYATILFMVFYGLGTGVTMLGSQYYGKGDKETIKTVEGIALRFSLGVSILFFIGAMVLPEFMMRVYTNENTLIHLGAEYLKYVAIAYLCWGVIEVYLSTLRCMGRVKIAMALNILAFSLNIIFNGIFIFGFFGMPKMGAAGAALGTTLSRVIELIGCMAVSYRSEDVKMKLSYMMRKNHILLKDFFNMALPALFNDVIWGLAFSMYSVILGHLGSDAVAANSLTTVVRNFGSVMCFGVASAGGIFIGQLIGEGKIEESIEAAREVMRFTLIAAALGMVLILTVTPFVLHFAALSDQAMIYLKEMLIINAFYIYGPAVNTTLIAGVFRAGGDSKFGFLVDSIDMWCYAVPLALFNAFVLKLPVIVVYFFMCTDEYVKWPWVLSHYRSGKWAKNITRDF